jgi:hypothetical protein
MNLTLWTQVKYLLLLMRDAAWLDAVSGLLRNNVRKPSHRLASC